MIKPEKNNTIQIYMPERKLFQVPHTDGTISIIGNTSHVDKNRPFALRNSSTPISEADFKTIFQETASLPVKGKLTDIVGWGGDSVCFRITDGNTRYAAVIRSNREPEKWDALKEHWDREQAIHHDFQPYTIPQNIVIVNGIDNEPAVMKITREVPGAPFSEISGFYLLIDKQLAKQFSDITRKNLRRFLTSGIIADPIGHIKTSKLRSIIERYALFFFDISNMVVDFEKNSLVVVDTEADDINKQPPHRKVQLLARAIGMGVDIGILELFKTLNTVRERVFPVPIQKKDVDAIQGVDELKKGFSEAVDVLNTSGLNYRIVGSFATAATINNAGGDFYLTPYRSDRTIRDIDMLVLDQNVDKARKLAEEYNVKRELNPFYPKIILSIPKIFEDDQGYPENKPTVLPIIVTRSAIDKSGNFHLVYSGEHKEIPVSYLDPVNQTYEGIEFPTLSPGVLAGLYLTRMGAFKSKDVEKVANLLDLTKAQIPVEFLDFAKTVRGKWPILYRKFLIRELLYHFSGGLIRKGMISSIKSSFH
ncbi:hypothetical protein HY945_04995 [Candidatus Gottesmanbacteria bacterium]|nr:hypothetical protein [Candidatus Gottesmanbacteria bacterium]